MLQKCIMFRLLIYLQKKIKSNSNLSSDYMTFSLQYLKLDYSYLNIAISHLKLKFFKNTSKLSWNSYSLFLICSYTDEKSLAASLSFSHILSYISTDFRAISMKLPELPAASSHNFRSFSISLLANPPCELRKKFFL